MNVRKPTPPSERFWSKVDKSGDCWLWTAATAGPMRYGVIAVTRDRMTYAHRLSWEMANGPIPEGLFVLHRCDTPLCVRPDHLFLGTHAENMRDMVAKGRSSVKHPGTRGSLNHQSKLTETAVRLIRGSSAPASVIARHLGVSTNLIYQIRLGTAWTWLEPRPSYVSGRSHEVD